MARKSERQTVPAIIASLAMEYSKNLKNFLILMLAALLVFLLLAAVFGVLHWMLESGNNSANDALGYLYSGARMLFDFLPFPPADDAINQPLAIIARSVGFVLTCLFSGIAIAIFLSPVNVIRFSKYAVVDLERNELRVRYWIRKPEQDYIFDASLELIIISQSELNRGDSRSVFTFRFLAPKDMDNQPEKYFGIRGVRYLDIPLTTRSRYDNQEKLIDALATFYSDSSSRIIVRIMGTDKSGRRIYREHRYPKNHILLGYEFVSIRRSEIESTAEAHGIKNDNLCIQDGKNLFHEHFDMVCKQNSPEKQTQLVETGLNENTPDPLYLLDYGQSANSSFIARMLRKRKLSRRS
ncbi:hypothetical protein [uncultured Adlercreutzia sp.]|uniref:hypothetical protein n=1 Tax=uncultured Adlercreutzia sp. TaxID=875803 RepID=UPI0026F4072E|nr:hypothetical protein [uncultured Adlercreutzia sp.]